MIFFKRIYVWCKRIRHRRGYGVHSPFAFGLITDVVYEQNPYYAFQKLKELRHLAKRSMMYPERVDRLLFRLVNRFSPQRIVEVGTGAGVSLCYMAQGKVGAQCVSFTGEDASGVLEEMVDQCKNVTIVKGPLMDVLRRELSLNSNVDFLHIAHTQNFSQVWEEFFPYVTEKTVVVIEGIHDTKSKAAWWEKIVEDDRTGITFDLYDLGIVFFDHTMNKQHYIVNF